MSFMPRFKADRSAVITFPVPALIRNSRMADIAREMVNARMVSRNLHQLDMTPDISEDAVQALCLEVLKVSKFLRVTPDDQMADLHAQIVANELVHQASLDVFKETRFAPAGTDKDCHVLFAEGRKRQRIVLGQIFTRHVTLPLEKDGMIDLTKLEAFSNVEISRNERPEILKGTENCTLFYSVTAKKRSSREDETKFFFGAGREVITQLSQSSLAKSFKTTTSPVRGFTQKVDREDVLSLEQDELRFKVLEYLSNMRDPVMKTHLGNGAYIGWINIYPENEVDFVVINYVYGDDQMKKQNRTDFKNGYLPISGALNSVPRGTPLVGKTCNISSSPYVTI